MSLTPAQCEEFWSTADKNGDGELTIQELAAAIRQWKPSNAGPNWKPPTTKDIAFIFSELDKDGDSRISKAEFTEEMSKEPRSVTLANLFKEMDKDGSGTLSRDEIKALVQKAGAGKKQSVDDVVEAIMSAADTSGDGVISFDEFVKALN